MQRQLITIRGGTKPTHKAQGVEAVSLICLSNDVSANERILETDIRTAITTVIDRMPFAEKY